MKAGNFAAAAESFASARRILPQDANLQRNLALAYNAWGIELAKQAQYDQALDRLQAAREILPGETLIASNITAIRINWATELMDQKKHEEAENQLVLAGQEAVTDDQRRESQDAAPITSTRRPKNGSPRGAGNAAGKN